MNIHQRNLQILTTESYKVKNDLAPDSMKDILHFAEKPWKKKFKSKKKMQPLVYLGTETIPSPAPKVLWISS